VWQGRRRLAQLEKELASTRAAQGALEQRVELFEKIAAAAGASLDEAAPDDQPTRPLAPVPAGLLAPVPAALLSAATDRRADGMPVRLAVGGRDVIAVIGDDEGGDPREWWTAIHKFAARLRSAS
jgi:hypothetical protein